MTFYSNNIPTYSFVNNLLAKPYLESCTRRYLRIRYLPTSTKGSQGPSQVPTRRGGGGVRLWAEASAKFPQVQECGENKYFPCCARA